MCFQSLFRVYRSCNVPGSRSFMKVSRFQSLFRVYRSCNPHVQDHLNYVTVPLSIPVPGLSIL